MTWQAVVHAWLATGSQLAAERVQWADQVLPGTNIAVPRPSSADGPWISIRELGETSGGSDWVVTERRSVVVDLEVSSVDAAANTLTTATAHGLARGDGPVQLTTTDTAPGGLAVETDYWALPVDATRLRLAESFLDAIAFTPIDLTSAGAGNLALESTDDTVTAGKEIVRTVEGTRTVSLSVQCFGGPTVDANGALARLKRTVAALSLPSVQAALRAANVGIASVTVDNPQNTGAAYQVAGFEPRATLTVRATVPIVDVSETGTVIETVTQTGTVT